MPGLDHNPDLTLLIEAAKTASEISLRYWRQAPKHWDKGDDQGPVSEADLAVNDHLKSVLTAARPDYGWLSEETPDAATRLSKERLFILDPIDGTRAFIAGEDNFAISLAVADGDAVVAGVVALPAKGRIYSATRGGPAFCNGTEIAVSSRNTFTGANILATKANMAAEYWPGGVPDLQRSFRTSLAYRLCLVAEGRFDGMLTFRKTWEWDIAAGTLIAAAAGAKITDQYGAALCFNSQAAQTAGVVAANPELHKRLLAQLKPLPPAHSAGTGPAE